MSVIKSLALASFLAVPGSAFAVTLFGENFDVDNTANWTVNASNTSSFADFFFDYSTYGIPSAPNSGGSTRGLKLEANKPPTLPAIFQGISVSPNGQSFAGDYVLRFDLWINTVGPMPAGGSGSTQVTGAGVLTAGTTPQWAGGLQDSLHFGSTGDGGSGVDYRAYSPAAGTGYTDTSGVFAAGNVAGVRNNSHAYYASLGSNTVPAAQNALFPATQSGTTAAGAPAFRWIDAVIEKTGNTVTYTMDGLLIATVDVSSITFGGGNILFTHYDINDSKTTNTSGLIFGLIDNVVVTPEPATLSFLALGIVALLPRRRR